MCGRFTLKSPPTSWVDFFLPNLDVSDLGAWIGRFNIAPTQNIVAIYAAIANLAGDAEQAASSNVQVSEQEGGMISRGGWMRWGLVPSWGDDLSIGSRMINARSETVNEKRSFKTAIAKRRCLIPADGYYEWQLLEDGKKQPVWIHQPGEVPFLMAGIWESNKKATGQEVRTCSILTTAANETMRPVHDRIPVIIQPSDAEFWLDPEITEFAAIQPKLVAPPEDYFVLRRVSTLVNHVRNEKPECIVPLAENPKLF